MSRLIVVVLSVLCFPAHADEIGELRKSLAAKAWSDRWQAVRALGDAGPRARAAVPDLIALLEGEDPLLSREAALALSKIAPEADAVVNALVKSLDRKGLNHGAALAALKASGKKAIAAQPWLVRRLKSGVRLDPHRRDLDLLAALDPPVAVYVDLLATKSSRVRARILAVLRSLGPKAREAIPAVCRLYCEENEAVRDAAQATLKAIGAESLCRTIHFEWRTPCLGGGAPGKATWGPTLWLFGLSKRSCVELIGILEDKAIGAETRRQLARLPFMRWELQDLVRMVRRAEDKDHVVHCAVLLLPLFADNPKLAEWALRKPLMHRSPAVRRAARGALVEIRRRKSATKGR